MIHFKTEVRIRVFGSSLAGVLAEACVWSLATGVDVHVSSIDDGADAHKPGTLHGFSLAADLSPDTGGPASLRSLADWLRVRLPAGYDVVLESDHVHIEADAHRPVFAPAR